MRRASRMQRIAPREQRAVAALDAQAPREHAERLAAARPEQAEEQHDHDQQQLPDRCARQRTERSGVIASPPVNGRNSAVTMISSAMTSSRS